MKPWKRSLGAAAVLLTVISAACGNDNESATGETPFTLGVVVPSSGPIGVVGPQAILGVEAAVKELNADGGILGRQVRIVTRDSKSQVETAVLAARDLLDNEHPDFLLPDTITTNALGILPFTTDDELFTMNNASGAALNDPAKFPYHFVFSNSKAQDVAAMISGTRKLVELGRLPKAETAAVLIYNSGVAQIVSDTMKKQLGEAGIDIVAEERYEPSTTDITVQLQQIRSKNPDVIYLSAQGPGVVVAMTGLRDIGWDDAVVMADASSALQDLDTILPPENKANLYFPALRPATREGDVAEGEIIGRLEAAGKIESLFVSVLTYDIVVWSAWAIEKAGTTDAEAVTKVLESVGSLPDDQLPPSRALRINPGYSPDNHSLGGGDLSQAWALAHVGPLISGTFPKLADIAIPAHVD